MITKEEAIRKERAWKAEAGLLGETPGGYSTIRNELSRGRKLWCNRRPEEEEEVDALENLIDQTPV